jgi:hypothetical protein
MKKGDFSSLLASLDGSKADRLLMSVLLLSYEAYEKA